MKDFLARAKANISLFVEHVIAFPASCMKVVTAGLRGLEAKVSSAEGVLIFFIALILIADLALNGRIGAVKFAIEQGTGLFKVCFDILKDAGEKIVFIVAVVWIAHIYKSKKP